MLVRLGIVAVLALSFLPLPASAQAPSGGILQLPGQLEQVTVPVAGSADLVAPWTYTFGSMAEAAAATASGGAQLRWKPPVCNGFALTGPLNQTFASDPQAAAQVSYNGTTRFAATALPGTEGERPMHCTLEAHVENLRGQDASPTVKTEAVLVVQFLGKLEASRIVGAQTGGPQKQITFPITIKNLGNSQTEVDFELVGSVAGSKWNAILPSPLFFGPAGGRQSEDTVQFAVATPFSNGYNSGAQNFTLRMTPRSTRDATAVGPPVTMTFDAGVKGWYLPGPDPWVPLLLVSCAIAVARNRRFT